MTQFRPFAALRYALAGASAAAPADYTTIVAPPYDVLSNTDRAALEALDARNSVRLDFPHGATDPDAYDGARRQLQAWQAEGTLAQDSSQTFTVYRMTATDDTGRTRSTTGVIGGLGLEPPGQGDVLPHEETTSKDKADRLDLIRATRINTSPIWGLSMAAGLGAHCAAVAEAAAPAAYAVDGDGVRHEAWIVTDPADIEALATIVSSAPVVIADGHHRFETALAFQAERRADGDGPGGCDALMALVVELAEGELEVRGIHRIITLPSGLDPVGWLATWFEATRDEPVDASIRSRMRDAGSLALVTPRGTWLLRPRGGAFADGIELDSQRIAAALAATPEASVRYHHDVATVVAATQNDPDTIGVLLRPATVAQIRAVAEARTRMPAKTTFFWPKPRTGMVFRPVD